MKEIKHQYFRIDLDNPAVPSFCSCAKAYFGTLADINEVVERMEQEGGCADTVAAFRRYLSGDLDVEHSVCYNKVKLLNPVELVSMELFELDDVQWNHTNVWDSIYTMHALHISVQQVVFRDGEYYCRCIRPAFKGLQYKSARRSFWADVGSCFWGNVGMLTGGSYQCELALFVEEERSKDCNAVVANMGAAEKLDYTKVCDEVFGNG